ncbi:MAG: heme-binding protein [Planctomycetota bacterium]
MQRITPLIVTAAAALLACPVWSIADEAGAAAEAVAEAQTDHAKDSSAMPEPREVYIEAELPQGYPAPGPAYEVLLKQYPAYRAARAEGGNAFRKLFNHIQSHDIAMTAPVEMTLKSPQAPDAADAVQDRDGFVRMDMMFMYADPDMGQLGQDATARPGEAVEVVDLPPVQVLSLGFFGNADRQQVNDALAMLERHLADRPELVAVGPPRLLGYNSPMVPADRRYSEVQIPVGPAEDAVSTPADSAADPAASPAVDDPTTD